MNEKRPCSRCQGRGTVVREERATGWRFRFKCPACNGKGST